MRLSRLFSSSVLAVAAFAAALPAWAAEEAEKASMPQTDVTFFPSQVFWLIITFATLYLLLKYFAIPGVERTQEKRSESIAAELAAAAKANEDAKRTIAEYEKLLADTRASAQAAVIDITTQSANELLQRQHEQQQVLTKRLREAEARIDAAREAALRDAQTIVSDVASMALEKLVGAKWQAKV